ncbi:hypothetical protein I317_06425 [Kwoniella heveanensis CBS 569]|nr:hypothetical protein I317_06425 [Kwoniella heveanensis CBS 569]
MSIHFAPQWVKPIKPSGTSLTPTTETPSNLAFGSAASAVAAGAPASAGGFRTSSHSAVAPSGPAVPFPALSGGGRASPTTNTNTASAGNNNPPLSYSRVTHTPLSPNFPQDASYFPYTEPNINQQNTENGAHPFRYSRDQILALFDESKFKDRPIELVELAEGGVLVAKSVNKPVGLRDLSEVEKKLLATSIHPPPPTRRQPTHNATNAPSANPTEPATPNGLPSRRGVGFARGEGGAFGGGLGGKIGTIGGGLISPGGLDSKAPGALGGGFGGVSKRLGRNRTEAVGDAAADSPRSTGPNWRPTRTASGSFEGVLGFGSTTPSAMTAVNPLSPNVDNHETPDAGNKGRNGDKWRIAAGLSAPGEGDKTLEVPISNEPSSASVIATPSATPVPDRDATILESQLAPAVPQRVNGVEEVSQPPALSQTQQSEEKHDLGNVEWFYRDPNGQEQGPFTGTQMHDWYSHSYFTDDLPLRRASETSFRPLAELKTATGNAVQPFLSPIRPRQMPPNLPIPIAALQQNGHAASLPDQFRNLGVSSPVAADPRISPQPPIQSTPQQFNQGFLPDRNAFSPNAYGGPGFGNGLGSPGAFGPAPGQGGAWNPMAPGGPRLNGPFGSIGMPSPIGQAPMPFVQPHQQQQYFSPQVGSPARGGDMFSPSVGVGAIPPSPWGIPQPHPQQGYPQHPVHQQQIPQQQPSPMPAWPTESAQPSAQPEIEQAVAEALAPVLAEEQNPTHAEHEAAAPVEKIAEEEEETAIPEPQPETAVEEESTPNPEPDTATPAKPPVQSAWGQNSPAVKAPSRKASIVETSVPSTPASAAPTPAAAASKSSTKATASTPAPPSASESPALPKTVAPATPGPTATPSALATPASEKTPSVASKPAPWAKEDKETKTPSGPSLREIQEAEAKRAEARKLALAEARAASASPALTPSASIDDFPTSIAWGLPSSNKGQVAAAASSPAAPSTPVMPVWGGSDAAPKKTLKQIQEEEEKRKAKAAQAARAAQAAAGAPASQKRGYADLAATHAPAPVPGWTTVGAGGKASAASVASAAVSSPSAARVVSTPIGKPATPVKAAAPATKKDEGLNGSAGAGGNGAPSVEFIRWTKQALTGFKGDLDDFIQVLLSFPIDIPASTRAETLEIISDSVYANSSTLDGRRFAQEFYAKRKADAARPASSAGAKGGVAKIASLADVVKTQPVKKGDDFGFKVVKGKGKKKTT